MVLEGIVVNGLERLGCVRWVRAVRWEYGKVESGKKGQKLMVLCFRIKFTLLILDSFKNLKEKLLGTFQRLLEVYSEVLALNLLIL
jgi:hypothetical protein